ncbi:MAG: Ldh family oxidoreductase [Deltaproteobacteria bacterium]|nr:Ldh family oxidoreductase [Deltaproteobacteria bacterium]
MAEKEIRVRYAALVDAVSRVLAREGVTEAVRWVEADLMAEADLLGVPSHGVRMLPGLVQAIRDGRCNSAPELTILRERGAICVCDCDHGPGRHTAVQAMSHAMERARRFGVGVCLAVKTTHWGRAHAYARRAAEAGMIGLCTTNAIPNMLAWGSSLPLLGNNPLAIAAPRGAGREPIVLDMAMSQAAVGKIGTYLREGKPVPPGWGLDASGRPTSDAAAILECGKLLPFGDHKGAGLAFMMELLTGVLAGAPLSPEIVQSDSSGLDRGATKLFLALDIGAFVDRERFGQRVEELIALIQAIEPGLSISLPGERGGRTRERYLAEGIPIHADIMASLRAIDFPL